MIFERQGYSYKSVDWLNMALVLVLGGVKSPKSRISQFSRIFQFPKHFPLIMAFFGEEVW